MSEKSTEKTIVPYWVTLGILAICAVFPAVVCGFLIITVIPEPYGWNTLNWNHIGILPIFALAISGVLLVYLLKTNHEKKLFLFSIILTTFFSFLFLIISSFQHGNLQFNGLFGLSFMLVSWVLALLPFLWKNHSLSLEKDWRNYGVIVTIVMWLSPLITEVITLSGWYLDGSYSSKIKDSVLGGMGFNDFLFIYGFATLLYFGSLIIFGPKIIRWMKFGRKKT